jgi:hypothetical protein
MYGPAAAARPGKATPSASDSSMTIAKADSLFVDMRILLSIKVAGRLAVRLAAATPYSFSCARTYPAGRALGAREEIRCIDECGWHASCVQDCRHGDA